MELCKEASGCSVVTYYEEEGDCLGFAECEELDDEDCQFCYTSDVNCDGEKTFVYISLGQKNVSNRYSMSGRPGVPGPLPAFRRDGG